MGRGGSGKGKVVKDGQHSSTADCKAPCPEPLTESAIDSQQQNKEEMKLKKKLREIEALEGRAAAGEKLLPNQLKKIESKSTLQKDLLQLQTRIGNTAVAVGQLPEGDLTLHDVMQESRELQDIKQELEQLSQDIQAAPDTLNELSAPLPKSCSLAAPTRSLVQSKPRPMEKASKEEQQLAAKRLFKCVCGVLNGAFGAEVAADCSHDVTAWLGHGRESANEPILIACDALAAAIEAGAVPPQGITVLLELREKLEVHGISSLSRLASILKRYICPRCEQPSKQGPRCQHCRGLGEIPCKKCSDTGVYSVPCRGCAGSGFSQGTVRKCPLCKGKGLHDRGACNSCQGGKARPSCGHCEDSRPLCESCSSCIEGDRALAGQRERNRTHQVRGRHDADTHPPPKGVTIERCTPSQFSDLSKLFEEREGSCDVEDAWKVDNPRLTWNFHQRRRQLEQLLGREPDELQGFHGTSPENIIPICQDGFDRSKRGSAVGQIFGSGEYFAKSPDVSIAYCKGSEYMLVCRLCLGIESSSEENGDGDHIWVPNRSYYVIASPSQILPLYIVKFAAPHFDCMLRLHMSVYGDSSKEIERPKCDILERVLESGTWTTKRPEKIEPVPQNRMCHMSRDSALVLWIGYLHAHLHDEWLAEDVRKFITTHAPDYIDGMKVQIVKGKFKKAHAVLAIPMPREIVHRLNKLPFIENGKKRTVCVEDAHGSPEQSCPKWIAGYCRGQNLRYTHPCWCSHPQRETERAHYTLDEISLSSAKGNEIVSKFLASAEYGFHDGMPEVVAVHAIRNEKLASCHEAYRKYLRQKHGDEPLVRELYHGTNNNILSTLCTHGLQPPSDCNASEACPVSGGKGLTTSLCTNTCRHCTERHEWNRCHMFGLGIYLADLAAKSHRYCSQPELVNGRRRFRMLVCSVLGRACKLEGHLRKAEAMHDVPNARSLDMEELREMVEFCGDGNFSERAEQSDLLFVQGLGRGCRPGFSVFNSEYIAFHPHQCLPKYEITYDVL